MKAFPTTRKIRVEFIVHVNDKQSTHEAFLKVKNVVKLQRNKQTNLFLSLP